MFLCGGDTHLFPVTSWDQIPVGEGEVGPVATRLLELLEQEAFGTGFGETADFIDVPYAD